MTIHDFLRKLDDSWSVESFNINTSRVHWRCLEIMRIFCVQRELSACGLALKDWKTKPAWLANTGRFSLITAIGLSSRLQEAFAPIIRPRFRSRWCGLALSCKALRFSKNSRLGANFFAFVYSCRKSVFHLPWRARPKKKKVPYFEQILTRSDQFLSVRFGPNRSVSRSNDEFLSRWPCGQVRVDIRNANRNFIANAAPGVTNLFEAEISGR